MNWWQELLNTLVALGWWRIVILIVAIILIGILLSTGIVYLFFHFVRKDPIRYSDLFGLLIDRCKTTATIPSDSSSQNDSANRKASILIDTRNKRILEELLEADKEAKQEAKETAERAKYEAEEKTRREALVKAETERLAREKAEQEAKETAERVKYEVEEKTRREALVKAGAGRLARDKAEQEAKIATEKAANKSRETAKSSSVLGEAYLAEIRTNLKIATSPWTGKPLPFHTSTMDNNLGEFNIFSLFNGNELREAYTDMAMGNNIVWLVTELGINNKDLEASYIKLCSKIEERLATILQENVLIACTV